MKNEATDKKMKEFIEEIIGEQPEIPTPAQQQIRKRIEEVQRKKGAIAEIVTCLECGCLIPVQAGGCGVCGNCGGPLGGC